MLTFCASKEYAQEALIHQNFPEKTKGRLQKLLFWLPGSKTKADSYRSSEGPPAPLRGRVSRQSKRPGDDESKEARQLKPLPSDQQASKPGRHTKQANPVAQIHQIHTLVLKQAIPTVRNDAEDWSVARMMYRASILQREPEGMMEAKHLYLRVLGEPDNKQTEVYKSRAARKLGLLFTKSGDQANAIKYYELAVEAKCQFSSYKLALLLEKRAEERGEPDSSEDLKRAFLLLQGAAEYHSHAVFELARFLEEGKGTKKDILQAKSFYEIDESTNKLSAYRLGRLHESGVEENGLVVIPQDLAKALKYYNQARLMHYPKAKRAHARLSRLLKEKNP